MTFSIYLLDTISAYFHFFIVHHVAMATVLSKGTRAFERHPLLQMNIKVIFQFVNRGGGGITW